MSTTQADGGNRAEPRAATGDEPGSARAVAAPVEGKRSAESGLYAGAVVDGRLHVLFAAQVRRTPHAVALVCAGRSLSYLELDEAANRLARLLQARGAHNNALVGVCLSRSAELVIALLAVLKTGCAYVPLDPSYPDERLCGMAEDARLALVVSDVSSRERLEKVAARVLVLEELRDELLRESAAALDVPGAGTDVAYVIYTSGSTGKPKGVMVEHRNVMNFLLGMRERLSLHTPGVWLSATSYGFDISVLEIFGSLTHGFKLVLLGESRWGVTSNPEYSLARELTRQRVTHFQCTPSQALLLLSDDEARRGLASVREFLVGGEALGLDVARRLLEACSGRLFNMYGPTETTIWSSSSEVRRGDAQISLGEPILNTTFHVLDEAQKPVPAGTIGELYIGGEGVARGYLGRPELTAERFIADAFSAQAGARLYRTGDLVRQRKDGSLEFLGRNDFQVKIRGYRIELGEIESVLRSHGRAREAVVVAKSEGEAEPRLIAYVVPQGEASIDAAGLRDVLRKQLPDYMVPAQFVTMRELPLTGSGKVDRGRLPEPGEALVEVARVSVLPPEKHKAPHFARVTFVEEKRSSSLPQPGERWLVLVDDTGLGERALSWLQRKGVEVISARLGHGPALSRESSHEYRVDSDRGPEGPAALIRELAAAELLPHVILSLWTVTTDERFRSSSNRFHHNEERGYLTLLGLAQGLLACDEKPDVRIVTVTNGALSVEGEVAQFPAKSMVLGPASTLPVEDARVRTSVIDVETPRSSRRALSPARMIARAHDALLDVLMPEVCARSSGVYALRGSRLFARTLVNLPSPKGRGRAPLRDHGTYLITGGFGGIGYALACELASRAKIRLVLLGRTPLPDRGYWPDWLASHDESDAVSRRIHMVRALEARGAEVLALGADVCHPDSMRSAFTQVRRRFGALNGVVHAAGVLDEALLAGQTDDQARDAIAAEVLGSRMLIDLTAHEKLDFLLLLGHATRFSPRPGVSARTAASHLSEAQVGHHPALKAFDLGFVSDAGMFAALSRELEKGGAVRDPNARALIAQVKHGMPVELAARAVVDGLSLAEPKLLIGDVPEALAFERTRASMHERVNRIDFVEPRGELELRMAALWAEALSVDRVGAEDDFFELGGHSLVAVRLTAKIKAQWGVSMPLALFIEAPTVRALARVIARELDAPAEAEKPRGGVDRLREWSTVVPLSEQGGSRPPLFCVGGKGGNVMNLRHLARLLGSDQPVFGLQARGVDGRLAPHRTLAGMVDEYFADLRKQAPHGPYFLAGFSGGGAIIVELARKLAAHGEVVAPLVFLDAWNPKAPQRTLLEKARAHTGLLRELGPRYVPIALKRSLLDRTRKLLTDRAPEIAQRIWEPPPDGGVVEDAWEAATSQYVPRPFTGSAVLFRVRANRDQGELDVTDDEHNGWGDVVRGGIEVIDVPGDHNSLLEEPHVRTLAQSLRLSLDRALRALSENPAAED